MAIIYGKSIKDRIDRQKKEDALRTKSSNYSLIASINKKKSPPIHKDVKYGKLYKKIIAEGEKEAIIRRRLSQMSYGTRNGQRKVDGIVEQNKGNITMLGQLNREKPLPAITKEMIKEYHDEEKEKPVIINGEIRKHNPASYQPNLTFNYELHSTDFIEEDIRNNFDIKTNISSRIGNIDNLIKENDDKIKLIKNEINEKGSNYRNIKKLQQEISKLEQLKDERSKLDKEMDLIDHNIKKLQDNFEKVKKYNADVNMYNREEVIKFEQSLNSMNKNRLNLQQQPYESEFDYYNRLREIEKEKFDPVLYKKYSENDATKKLKDNLKELFSNTGFNEEVLSKIPPEDKFIINNNFNDIRDAYIDLHGYNTTSLSPTMVSNLLKNFATIYRNEERQEEQNRISVINDIFENAQIEERQRQRQERQIQRQEREQRISNREVTAEAQQIAERQRQFEPIQNAIRQRLTRNAYQNVIPRHRERQQQQINQLERNIEQYLQNLERGLPVIENRLERRIATERRNEEEVIAPERELTDYEIIKNRNARKIQKVFRGHKGRKELEAARIEQEAQEAREGRRNKRVKERELLNTYNTNAERIGPLIKEQQRISKENVDYKKANIIQNAIRNKLAKNKLISHKIDASQKALEERAATNIQKIVKGNIEREKIYNMIENLSNLSSADTIPQIYERLRQQRADKGKKRMPYKTVKNLEAAKVINSVLRGHKGRQQYNVDKEAARIGILVQEADARARAEAEEIEHEKALSQIREEMKAEAKGKAKRGRKPKGGSGIVIKPSRRTVKITNDDKKKNRLRLITSEIHAGNTNPKLIVEVNKLYKQLYNIDNAYLFLKK